MANVTLKNIKKIYPNADTKKKKKKKEHTSDEPKANLQITDEGVVAVQEFSLDIADREFIVLVGPSGCGKSTTLRMIAGLEEITDGELYIGDRLVNDVAPKDRDIAMVFQNYALYPHMTVYENMAFSLKLKKVPKQEIDKKVREAAEILGITEYLDRKPKALSGGQRQRVAMGRAIVREPSVFLFDEPLSNLDAKLRVQTRLQIQKLHRRLKTTSLYVTHDQVEAMTLAHRMIVMNAGRAEQVGTPQEVYDDPETMFVANFIGSPPMNLVHGRVSADGSHFEHDSGVLSLPEPCTALAGRAVVLGVRPEHVTLRPEGGLAAFEVETVEALGADHLIHGVLLGQNVVFRVDNHMYIPEVGIRAGLEFSAEHVYWFDPETTKRIRL